MPNNANLMLFQMDNEEKESLKKMSPQKMRKLILERIKISKAPLRPRARVLNPAEEEMAQIEDEIKDIELKWTDLTFILPLKLGKKPSKSVLNPSLAEACARAKAFELGRMDAKGDIPDGDSKPNQQLSKAEHHVEIKSIDIKNNALESKDSLNLNRVQKNLEEELFINRNKYLLKRRARELSLLKIVGGDFIKIKALISFFHDSLSELTKKWNDMFLTLNELHERKFQQNMSSICALLFFCCHNGPKEQASLARASLAAEIIHSSFSQMNPWDILLDMLLRRILNKEIGFLNAPVDFDQRNSHYKTLPCLQEYVGMILQRYKTPEEIFMGLSVNRTTTYDGARKEGLKILLEILQSVSFESSNPAVAKKGSIGIDILNVFAKYPEAQDLLKYTNKRMEELQEMIEKQQKIYEKEPLIELLDYRRMP